MRNGHGETRKKQIYWQSILPNNMATEVIPNTKLVRKEITIKFFIPGEIRVIIKALNPRKAARLHLITARILQELPRKSIVMLTYLFTKFQISGRWPKTLYY